MVIFKKEETDMAMFNKVLFPVDLSEASAKVCPYVKEVAEKFDAQIHIIYVVHVTHYYSSLDISDAYMGKFETEIFKGAESKLQDFITSHFKDQTVVTKVLVGRPGDEIVNYVKSEAMDMVVMGHSSTGIGRAIFGSVAGFIVKYSPVSVMVISPNLLKSKKLEI
jgi:nucleotide-binding universal stress UspA family protein